MEKYRLVEERKSAVDEVLPNEVRITQQGKPRNYITYAMTLFVSFKIFQSLQSLMLKMFNIH